MKSEDKPFFVLLIGDRYSKNPEDSVDKSLLVDTLEEAGRMRAYATAVNCCSEFQKDVKITAPVHIQRVMIEDVT